MNETKDQNKSKDDNISHLATEKAKEMASHIQNKAKQAELSLDEKVDQIFSWMESSQNSLSENSKTFIEHSKEKIHDVHEKSRQKVHEQLHNNPVQSLSTVFGLGLLIGFFISRK